MDERLLQSCDLELLIADKKPKSVRVEILEVVGDTFVLKTTKISKDSELLNQINTQYIGSILSIKIEQIKDGFLKMKMDTNCLVIVYKASSRQRSSNPEWLQLILCDPETPTSCNSVSCIAKELEKISIAYQYRLKSAQDEPFTLQVFTDHVAIVQEDRSYKDVSSVSGDQDRLKGMIFRRSDIRNSLNLDNSNTTIKTNHDQMEYRLCDRTTDSLMQDIGRGRELPPTPLPPLPAPALPIPNGEVSSPCGIVPDIDAIPFWLDENYVEDDDDGYSIYGSINALGQHSILEHNEQEHVVKNERHIREVCQRQKSRRFRDFETKIQPDYIPEQETDCEIYKRPRVSLFETPPRLHYSEECIEMSVVDFMKEWPDNIEGFPEVSKVDKQIFCVRLDVVETSHGGSGGWQDFAGEVMDLESEDIRLFDEYSCRYRLPVVEILLYHWLKLKRLNSGKCKANPTKRSLIDVLVKMEKLDLLHRLSWA